MTLPNVPSWKHSSFYPIKAIDAIFEGFDFVNCPDGPDCDDDNENVNPDATEVCNGIDDDCDGQVDERCFAFGW